MKIDIRNLNYDDLEIFCLKNKLQKFRAKQIDEWLWKKRAQSFNQMSSLPNHIRDLLSENFSINHVNIHKKEKSKDGTIKYSLKLWDNSYIEGVLIFSKKRITACISSQVGCSLDCNFCATGTLKLKRNISASEIFDQVYILNNEAVNLCNRPLSNIVFMGMGEPLLNYSELLKGINKITSKNGLNISSKRITVSTAGVTKMIKKLADDMTKFNLAISLHSAKNEIRSTLMPINKKIDLQDIKEANKYYYNKTKKIVTYEYILFDNINDSLEDARLLFDFAKDLYCKINLIEYNPVKGFIFKKSSNKRTMLFIDFLKNKNINVTLRKSKGKDINAACGQLVNELK